MNLEMKPSVAELDRQMPRSQIIKITVRSQLPVMKDFKIIGRPMSAEATWQDFFDSVKIPFDKNNHAILTSRSAPRVNEPIKNTSSLFKKLAVIIKVVRIGEEKATRLRRTNSFTSALLQRKNPRGAMNAVMKKTTGQPPRRLPRISSQPSHGIPPPPVIGSLSLNRPSFLGQRIINAGGMNEISEAFAHSIHTIRGGYDYSHGYGINGIGNVFDDSDSEEPPRRYAASDTSQDSQLDDEYSERKRAFLRAAEGVSNAHFDAFHNEIRTLRQLSHSQYFRWHARAPLFSSFAVAWYDRH